MNFKVYKIYDTKTNLFYNGGKKWNKDGKIFSKLAHVRSAIRFAKLKDIETIVIEYELCPNWTFALQELK